MVGVKRAQRVELDPCPYLIRESLLMCPQMRLQALAVLAPGLRAAEARQGQLHMTDPHLVSQARAQRDRLGVERRVVRPERLGPHLPELTIATGLGTLVAEEAREIPKLH